MDFGLSDEQQAVVDLARQILTDRTTPDRLRELEAGADWVDRDLWAELAKADLLGLCLPEAHGGGGYGFLEACLILEAQGRAVAPLPLLGTLVGALVVAESGSEALAGRLLPGVATGAVVLTAALAEPAGDPRRPVAVRAGRDGAQWRLSGTKTMVPLAHVADVALVTAATDDGAAVFAVDLQANGITTERQDTFNHEPTFVVTFDDVTVPADDVVGAPGDGTVDRLADLLTVGLCAITSGVSERAMRITAEYTTTRKQFDKPIGTFQAVVMIWGDLVNKPVNAAARAFGLYAVPRVHHVLNVLHTLLIWSLGLVMFRAVSMRHAGIIYSRILDFDGIIGLHALALKGAVYPAIMCLFVTGLLILSYRLPKDLNYKHPRAFMVAVAMLVIVLGKYGDQFYYFQF